MTLIRVGGMIFVLLVTFAINTWDLYSTELVKGDIPEFRAQELPLFDRFIMKPLLKLKEYQDPPSLQVSTVAFGAGGLTYLQADLCRGRMAMADLIDALGSLGAREVVIDKYYGRGSCSDPQSNQRFRAALSGSRLEIVVGLETMPAEDHIRGWALTLPPSFRFTKTREASGTNDLRVEHPVVEGLTRLNSNLLKIPLEWPVSDLDLGDRSRQHGPERMVDTLSFASARLAAPELVTRHGLSDFLRQGVDPYGESTQLEIKDVSADEVLCSDSRHRVSYSKRWHLSCTSDRSPALHSVVVIGSPSEQDRFDVAGRPLYGYQLQALYIEELLSARYLREVPFKVWYSILLVWAVVAQAWLILTDSPGRVFAKVGLLTALLVLLLIVALIAKDYFPPLRFIFFLLTTFAVMGLLELAESVGAKRHQADATE